MILKRTNRRLIWTVVVLAAVGMLGAPASANHVFTDVNTGDYWHDAATWAKDNAISLGCTATTFCPQDFTKRGDMAVFLNRLVTNPLEIEGPLRVGSLVTGTSYNHIGSGGTPLPASDISNVNDLFVFGDLNTGLNAYIATDGGALVVGDPTPTANQSFSSFGEADGKDEAAVSAGNDVYIAGDLEVDALAFINSIRGTTGSLDVNTGFDVEHMTDDDNDDTLAWHEWYHNGTETTANTLAQLHEDGDLLIRGTIAQSQTFDIAEAFIAGASLQPGDVVRVDPGRPTTVLPSSGAYDAGVIGIVSTKPGIVLGGAIFDVESLRQGWGEALYQLYKSQEAVLTAQVLSEHPEVRGDATKLEQVTLDLFAQTALAKVALAGRVPVKVDTQFGAIKAGDMLTASPIPGVAMKATQAGPVIGTALQDLDSGSGKILVFVNRTWYSPGGGDDQVLLDRISSLEAKVAALSNPAGNVEALVGNVETDNASGLFLGAEGRGSVAAYAALAAAIMLIGMLIGARIVVTVAGRKR